MEQPPKTRKERHRERVAEMAKQMRARKRPHDPTAKPLIRKSTAKLAPKKGTKRFVARKVRLVQGGRAAGR